MKQLLRHHLSTAGALALAAVLCGCAWSIGSKDDSPSPKEVQPTKGAELLDLKRAYEQGAINEQEYQDQRARVLERK